MDKRFNYRVEVIPAATPPVNVENYLNSLGDWGWQLVTVQGDRYFFERPR